jgi:hypothetical protein
MGKRNFHRRVSHGKALSNLWLQEVLQAECEYFAPIITNLPEIIKSCCFIAKGCVDGSHAYRRIWTSKTEILYLLTIQQV